MPRGRPAGSISRVTDATAPGDAHQPEQPERGIHPRSGLARDLARVGVEPGATLLVHSALRSLGFVPGGPVAVVQALLDAVGPRGTLVVPTQTGADSDPSGRARPPLPPGRGARSRPGGRSSTRSPPAAPWSCRPRRARTAPRPAGPARPSLATGGR